MKQIAKFETENDIQAFDHKVWELAESKDSEVLSHLLELFDDNTDHPEVMYSLVHAVESYPKEIYLTTLIYKIPYMIKNSPEFLMRLIYGILNHDEYLIDFKKKIHKADPVALEQTLTLIEEDSEEHRPVVAELRKVVQGSIV